jgi:hypothetical protein
MRSRTIAQSAATAAALLAALALPLSGEADPLSVFQPAPVRSVSVRPVDVAALRALPPLDEFGTIQGAVSPGIDEPESALVASRDAGYALRLPAALPAALPDQAHYRVSRRSRTSFTFSRAKAAQWAHRHKVALHPLPPGLDGATYTMTLQPIAVVTYGSFAEDGSAHAARMAKFVAVVQGPVPTLTATGAPLRALTGWFAAQPGISKRLVAQIEALGDPAQAIPVPVRFNEQTAAKVAVDGVQGLAIGDETGIGSAIVWTKAGRLYAVAGTLTQSEILALANDLK